MSEAYTSTGLTSSQLEQLCQPEQLERTLHLLFFMNHWAKARERLFFADRQGLYQVKGALLQQAYAFGAIESSAYIDGILGFGRDISLDSAADIAAEGVIERLAGLSNPDPFMSDIHEKFNAMACQFYVADRDVNAAKNILQKAGAQPSGTVSNGSPGELRSPWL